MDSISLPDCTASVQSGPRCAPNPSTQNLVCSVTALCTISLTGPFCRVVHSTSRCINLLYCDFRSWTLGTAVRIRGTSTRHVRQPCIATLAGALKLRSHRDLSHRQHHNPNSSGAICMHVSFSALHKAHPIGGAAQDRAVLRHRSSRSGATGRCDRLASQLSHSIASTVALARDIPTVMPEEYWLPPGEISAIDRSSDVQEQDIFRCFGCTRPECEVRTALPCIPYKTAFC